jgi:hypothetical protein
VDLDEVRSVEGLKWVRFATVQRVLPDTIGIGSSDGNRLVWPEYGAQSFSSMPKELLEKDRGSG